MSSRFPGLRDILIALGLSSLMMVILFGSVHAFSSKQPQIVVQMPADAAPLEQITTAAASPEAKVITQDRAVLWITVYKATLDKGFSAGYCADQADRAVKAAYGAAKP